MDPGFDDIAGITVPDSNCRVLVVSRNEALINCKQCYCSDQVSAVGPVSWTILARCNIREFTFDINIRIHRTGDNGDLAQQDISTTEPIDLPRIRRTNRTHEQPVPQDWISWQITFMKKQTTTGSSTHYDAWNGLTV
jgi:hypothetical protein